MTNRTPPQKTPDRPHWFEPMYGLKALVRDPEGKDDRWTALVSFVAEPGQKSSAPGSMYPWPLSIWKVELTCDLSGGRPFDVATWRSFPLARIVSEANMPDIHSLLWMHSTDKPDGEDRVDTKVVNAAVSQRPKGRLPIKELQRLQSVTPQHRPDRFYEVVAIAYRFYVEHGHHPAKVIAEDCDVPLSTVNRWIREARQRGLLAPTRKGRVS